jgi:hypothetical protein
MLIGYENDAMPNVVFNYLGQFNQNNENLGFWEITDDNAGNPVDPGEYGSQHY